MYQTIFVRLCQRGVFSRLYTVKSVVFFSHVCCSSLHFDRIFLFGCFYYVAGSDSAMVTVHALWLFGFIMDGEDVKGNVFKPITPNTKCLFLASKVRLLAFFLWFLFIFEFALVLYASKTSDSLYETHEIVEFWQYICKENPNIEVHGKYARIHMPFAADGFKVMRRLEDNGRFGFVGAATCTEPMCTMYMHIYGAYLTYAEIANSIWIMGIRVNLELRGSIDLIGWRNMGFSIRNFIVPARR